MQCPSCQILLQMTDRQGIEVDYCPQCRGIWLDRGELEKLIDRSLELEPRSNGLFGRNDGYRDESRREREDHRYPGHHRKRESWLGRLFDLD